MLSTLLKRSWLQTDHARLTLSEQSAKRARVADRLRGISAAKAQRARPRTCGQLPSAEQLEATMFIMEYHAFGWYFACRQLTVSDLKEMLGWREIDHPQRANRAACCSLLAKRDVSELLRYTLFATPTSDEPLVYIVDERGRVHGSYSPVHVQ